MKVKVYKKIHKIKISSLINKKLSGIKLSSKIKKVSDPYKKNCKVAFRSGGGIELVTPGTLTLDLIELLFCIVNSDAKVVYKKKWSVFFKKPKCYVGYDDVHGLIVVVPGRLTKSQIILLYYHLLSGGK